MPVLHALSGYQLIAPGVRLQLGDLDLSAPAAGDVIIEVAGCGLCHTDIGFAYGGVPTRHPLPLVLGHEIAGRVVEAGDGAESWIGKAVIVPAVIPCGTCPACLAGRPTICRRQFMPGNDGDGGFASHVRVPARGLCPVPDALPEGITLAMLSVVADAVTTPFEAIQRSKLAAGDVAIFVGAGGVGAFGVQIAAALGAVVVAIDISDERLALAAQHGATLTFNSRATSIKDLKSAIRTLTHSGFGSKIFETSGTTGGQETAFSLLDFGAHLAVVGYTADKVALRLSNLMAFDATAQGNWGCAPENYPKALDLVLRGKVALAPFVELHAIEELPDLFEAARDHRLRLRPVVVP